MNLKPNTNLPFPIHTIRGQKVMLDHDLARLYGIETKALKRAVKRNTSRFPEDFMFQLAENDSESSRYQIGTLNVARGQNLKYAPYAFTELGIAMLSSVLRSEQAVQVNISIMRTFFGMRDLIKNGENAEVKIQQLEKNTTELFKIVFERMDRIERVTPALSPKRRKIGI